MIAAIATPFRHLFAVRSQANAGNSGRSFLGVLLRALSAVAF
jgi:hypothetical protein